MPAREVRLVGLRLRFFDNRTAIRRQISAWVNSPRFPEKGEPMCPEWS